MDTRGHVVLVQQSNFIHIARDDSLRPSIQLNRYPSISFFLPHGHSVADYYSSLTPLLSASVVACHLTFQSTNRPIHFARIPPWPRQTLPQHLRVFLLSSASLRPQHRRRPCPSPHQRSHLRRLWKAQAQRTARRDDIADLAPAITMSLPQSLRMAGEGPVMLARLVRCLHCQRCRCRRGASPLPPLQQICTATDVSRVNGGRPSLPRSRTMMLTVSTYP